MTYIVVRNLFSAIILQFRILSITMFLSLRSAWYWKGLFYCVLDKSSKIYGKDQIFAILPYVPHSITAKKRIIHY